MSENKTTVTRKPASATMWAITGLYNVGEPETFLYCGTWLTRSAAIEQHTTEIGKSWSYCRSRGDRAVRVKMQEIANGR